MGQAVVVCFALEVDRAAADAFVAVVAHHSLAAHALDLAWPTASFSGTL